MCGLGGCVGGAGAIGCNNGNSFSLNGTDSQRAVDLLKREFPAQSGDSDQIVFAVRSGSVTSPAARARIAPMLQRVAQLPHVSGVVSPYSPACAQAVPRNPHIASPTLHLYHRA